MKQSCDPFENESFNRLHMFTCLIPVFGMFPAVWALSQRGSDRHLRQVSRLSITIGLLWGIGFFLLNSGIGYSEAQTLTQSGLTLLVGNSVWSSGYFVTLLWLMTRLWRGQSLTVAGVSQLAKYLP